MQMQMQMQMPMTRPRHERRCGVRGAGLVVDMLDRIPVHVEEQGVQGMAGTLGEYALHAPGTAGNRAGRAGKRACGRPLPDRSLEPQLIANATDNS